MDQKCRIAFMFCNKKIDLYIQTDWRETPKPSLSLNVSNESIANISIYSAQSIEIKNRESWTKNNNLISANRKFWIRKYPIEIMSNSFYLSKGESQSEAFFIFQVFRYIGSSSWSTVTLTHKLLFLLKHFKECIQYQVESLLSITIQLLGYVFFSSPSLSSLLSFKCRRVDISKTMVSDGEAKQSVLCTYTFVQSAFLKK